MAVGETGGHSLVMHSERVIKDMKILGIDIGTTSISAVVYDTEEERTLETRSVENRSFIRTENSWERLQDPAYIIERSVKLIDDLTDEYSDIGGIGLTGRREPLIHVSNAAGIGDFDVERRRFRREDLRSANVDPSIYPDVTEGRDILGYYRNIPVVTAIGDNQASFLGADKGENDTLLVNIGTGSQVSAILRDFQQADGLETRPYIDGRYLIVGASLCGGRAYAVLERFFREYVSAANELTGAGGEAASQYEIMGKLAGKGRKNRSGVRAVTTFSGTRQDPKGRGQITGLSEDNFTPENVIYAVLDGMVRELYEMYQCMSSGDPDENGIRVRRLAATGNGVRRNPVLMDIIEEKFGMQAVLSEEKEEAALGAALFAAGAAEAQK